MGKFGDYVNSIEQQTKLLRNNLTEASGIDCNEMSIGGCAQVVRQYITDEPEIEGYVRPEWHPNVKEILNNAPNITKNGSVYYPAYIMLLVANEDSTPFYKSGSYSTSVVNYGRGIGGDAILCSDSVDSIENVTESSLEVGTTLTHIWDKSKDITHLGEGVRWVVVYVLDKTKTITPMIMKYSLIEFISGECSFGSSAFLGNEMNYTCKYIEFQKNTTFIQFGSSGTNYHTLNGFRGLEEILVSCPTKYIGPPAYSSNACRFLENCDSLKKITLPETLESIYAPYFLSNARNLKYFKYPSSVKATSVLMPSSVYATGLKTVILPESVSYPTTMSLFESNIEVLKIPEGIQTMTSGSDQPFLHTLILPTTLKEITSEWSGAMPKLDYLKIPSSLRVWKTSKNILRHTTYIELYNDFDISGVNLTGTLPKKIQWLKDLCGWLKDRTGDTANTLILGTDNLKNAQNIWLLFDATNKRDITWVPAGTEGAINIAQFITEQLNWTLS